jgi:uncharacterized membrane protein
MIRSKIFLYVRILSIIGILLSVYLLWQQIFRPSFQPCNINATVNCDAIVSGPVSKTIGLPTPLYGLLGYIVIFLSSIFLWKKTLLGTATFGLLFCLWIAYQELFLLHVICPVCIGCQIVMIAVFSLGLVIIRSKKTSSSS